MKSILDQVDAALKEIDRRHDEAVAELITPLIVKEFKKVQRKNPKLKRILFGNGTYLLDGIEDSIKKDYNRAAISGDLYVTAKMPKYLERLYELCERVSGFPIEDIE